MRNNVLLLLLLLGSSIYAQECFRPNCNTGNFGYGMNIPFNGNSNIESFANILNFGIEHERTKIGFDYTPTKFWEWKYYDKNRIEIKESVLSFINLNLYWNILNWEIIDTMNLFLGPFTTINYLFMDENNIVYGDKFIITNGLRIGLIGNVYKNINYYFLGGEIGYRNINGDSRFYMSVNIDILIYLIMLFSTIENKK
jgi:hypothetical protein